MQQLYLIQYYHNNGHIKFMKHDYLQLKFKIYTVYNHVMKQNNTLWTVNS